MFDKVKIKTFQLDDLVGRTVSIRSFKEGNKELICAKDLKSGDFFVLKEINHPAEDLSSDFAR